jgi:very-short-patch-repair endonuclease
MALGLSREAIARRLRSGRLHRLHRGVYAVGHTALTREGRWLAAVLACGPGALLSHRSAAALWGLRPTSAPRIDIIVPRTNHHRSTDCITVHHATRTARVHNNIPTTSPTCTLVDLAAANLPRRQIEKAAETAEALGLLDAREVRGRLKAILAAHDLSTRTRSTLEDAFLALCDGAKIGRPAVNATIQGLEVDFHWPDVRLIVETDSHRHHGTRAAFERDRVRDQQLTVAGWRVVRFTHRQVLRTPEHVKAILLSARSRSPSTP